MYSDGNENDERIMREKMRRMRHDLREAGHALKDGLRQAEHAKIDALRQAMKYGMPFPSGIAPYPPAGFGNEKCMSSSTPRTTVQILEEIDSYISYLEDLPKEKMMPYQEKLGDIEEHLKKLRGTLAK